MIPSVDKLESVHFLSVNLRMKVKLENLLNQSLSVEAYYFLVLQDSP